MIRLLILLLLATSCDTGNMIVVADLPLDLNEVSGTEISSHNGSIWMINDSGNKPILYGLNENGTIMKAIRINAKNRDWEDLTIDLDGNIYIGNFGNNANDSKNLSILKISIDSLNANLTSITPEIIEFTYPDQSKFPPKKAKRHFDCESFFFYRDSLYLFTKSRAPKKRGTTNLYQLPSISGRYEAKYISSFNTCEDSGCWVTSADIDPEENQMALLTENSVFIFSEFIGRDFFSAEFKRYPFQFNSQKESVCFKNDSTLYITDEYLGMHGGNLYEFKIN